MIASHWARIVLCLLVLSWGLWSRCLAREGQADARLIPSNVAASARRMLFIPPGTWRVGCGSGVHDVQLAAYWMDEREVTCNDYNRFLVEAAKGEVHRWCLPNEPRLKSHVPASQ